MCISVGFLGGLDAVAVWLGFGGFWGLGVVSLLGFRVSGLVLMLHCVAMGLVFRVFELLRLLVLWMLW